MDSSILKILIVDDHQIVVEGLSSLVDKFEGFEVSGTANNMKEAVSRIRDCQPDILITDLNMPGKNGIEMIKELRSDFPSLRIVVLTMYFDRRLLKSLKEENVNGILPKNSQKDELKQLLTKVAQGETVIHNSLDTYTADYDLVLDEENSIRDSFIRRYSLGAREYEVFLLVASGKQTNEIAEILHISPETVSTHRKNLKLKTGLKNSAEIAAFAIRNELLQ